MFNFKKIFDITFCNASFIKEFDETGDEFVKLEFVALEFFFQRDSKIY